jgi:hypothetical protein
MHILYAACPCRYSGSRALGAQLASFITAKRRSKTVKQKHSKRCTENQALVMECEFLVKKTKYWSANPVSSYTKRVPCQTPRLFLFRKTAKSFYRIFIRREKEKKR